MTDAEKAAKARVEAERREVIKLTVEQKVEKAIIEAERRDVIKFTVEQKVEKARVEAERRIAAGVELLAAETRRKAERRGAKFLQVAAIRLIDDRHRHRYAKPRLTVEQKEKNVRIETEKTECGKCANRNCSII